MPDQGRQKQGIQPRSAGTNGRIEVRPRNWLVPVILLTLRECTSYGYKLMEQTAAFGFGAMNRARSTGRFGTWRRTACASPSGTRPTIPKRKDSRKSCSQEGATDASAALSQTRLAS
jgi:hypothetical protein